MYLTRREVAQRARCSVNTIRRLEERGLIPKALRIGRVGKDGKFRGAVAYPTEALDNALERLRMRKIVVLKR